jgi:DNA-binding response OmpR family regulator
MHILFVEDEAKIANFVRAGLKEQGFVRLEQTQKHRSPYWS